MIPTTKTYNVRAGLAFGARLILCAVAAIIAVAILGGIV